MAKALIITDSATAAFRTLQVLTGLFSQVKACDDLVTAREMLTSFQPDLVVATDMPCSGFSAPEVVRSVVSGSTPSVLLCAGLQGVKHPDPPRSIRIVPPLTQIRAKQAVMDLGLTGIVSETSLPLPVRNPANE